MYDFGQKIETLLTHSLFWGKIGHEIYFGDITDGKKANKLEEKSQNSNFSKGVSPWCCSKIGKISDCD